MLIKIYPENPNPREIVRVVNLLKEGGLVIYPTDTVYAIGCDALNIDELLSKKALPGTSATSVSCTES